MSAGPLKYMPIGIVAKNLGITARTIRLYEKLGLIDCPNRTEGGRRLYGQEDIRGIEFVLKLKAVGITLQEMQELRLTEGRDYEKFISRLPQILESIRIKCLRQQKELKSLEQDIIEFKKKILGHCGMQLCLCKKA